MTSKNNDPQNGDIGENEPDDSSGSFSASEPQTEEIDAVDEQLSSDMVSEGGIASPSDNEGDGDSPSGPADATTVSIDSDESDDEASDEPTAEVPVASEKDPAEPKGPELDAENNEEPADGAVVGAVPVTTTGEAPEAADEQSVPAETQSNTTPPQDSTQDSLAGTTPQFRGALLAGWGVAAVALLAIGGYTVYNATQTTVPQAPVYYASDDSKASEKSCDAFTKADLKCEVLTKDSYDIPAGGIIEQSADAGSQIKKDSTIKIIYSAGPQFGEMPDVAGLPLDTASTELAKESIKVSGTKKVDNSGYPAGRVVEGSVREGAVTDKDQEIQLTISSGVTRAPDFSNMSADQALKAATDAGLTGKINWVEGAAPYGVVVGQSVQAGEEIADGMVTVDVSRPYEGSSLQIPEVEGEKQDKALEKLYESGITMLNIVEVEGGKDEVLSVSPSESQYVSSTQVVTVVVSSPDSE